MTFCFPCSLEYFYQYLWSTAARNSICTPTGCPSLLLEHSPSGIFQVSYSSAWVSGKWCVLELQGEFLAFLTRSHHLPLFRAALQRELGLGQEWTFSPFSTALLCSTSKGKIMAKAILPELQHWKRLLGEFCGWLSSPICMPEHWGVSLRTTFLILVSTASLC